MVDVSKFRKLPPGVRVRVSEDKMTAEVLLDPEKAAEALTPTGVREVLAASGIVYGIDDEAISTAIEKQGEWVVVAKGVPPTPPIDARIEFPFAVEKGPKEKEGGRVDLHELGLIENVTAGQILARRHPPKPGEAGRDVKGNEIPARPPREATIEAGANVELSPDGNEARATTDGRVIARGNKVSVEEVFEAEEIGAETGNVDFVGAVVVRGAVRAGFRVAGRKGVFVKGTIEGAEVVSGADVVVGGGVMGGGKAVVRAKGDFSAKHVQDARIEAASIRISGDCLRAELYASGSVEVEGKFVGGRSVSGGGFSAAAVGSENETPTVVEVGIAARSVEAFEKLEAAFQAARARYLALERECAPIEQARQSGRAIEPERKQKYEAMSAEKEERLDEMLRLAGAVSALELASPKPALLEVGVVYPGAVLGAARAEERARRKNDGVHLVARSGVFSR